MREQIAAHPDVAYLQPGVRVIDDHGAEHRPLGDRIKAHYRPDVDSPREIGGEELTRSLLRGNWMYFPATVLEPGQDPPDRLRAVVPDRPGLVAATAAAPRR